MFVSWKDFPIKLCRISLIIGSTLYASTYQEERHVQVETTDRTLKNVELLEFSEIHLGNTSNFERQIYFSDAGKGWSNGWVPPKKHRPKGPGNTVDRKKERVPLYAFDDGTDVAVESTIPLRNCDRTNTCQHSVHCASFHPNFLRFKDRRCRHKSRSQGVCCPHKFPQDSNAEVIGNNFRPYSRARVKIPDIAENMLAAAARFGLKYAEELRTLEERLLERNYVVQRGTPAHGHLQFFKTTPAVLQVAKQNFLVIKASEYMHDKYDLTLEEAGVGLQEYSFQATALAETCPRTPSCNANAPYRSHDGSCNNVQVPKLGQSRTPLLRLLSPDYADGIWAPRRRRDGDSLPNPRFISRSLVPDANLPDFRYSHLVMQFGQFIDHDLSHVPIFRYEDLSGINCCHGGGEDYQHPACFPIEIPQPDPYIPGECMNFVRSMIAPRLNCDFGHADQLNQLTHWLDASQIYGNTGEHSHTLRTHSGGFLAVTRDPHGRHLLPLDLVDEDQCGVSTGLNCFDAGDKRVNEQIGLTTMHTIWVREHNRVAAELGRINVNWKDELLYQETRRIVIAEYQHIIYNEWLPIILGRKYMEVFGILLLYQGYYEGYSASVDPSVSNAFTTAAFRLHTLIQGSFNLQNSGGRVIGMLQLRDFFNKPHLLREPGVIDLLSKGFVTQPLQRFDNFVTTEVRDHLFEENMAAMDLIALNIQRGRDHGLPSYNEYRDLCRLGKARDFFDLQPIISPGKLALLQQVYRSVDDIDLFIGGIFETPLEDALVGPTFVCIIGDQFVRSQKADRFFYSVGGESHSFTPAQLHDIRGVSMARILCDNSDEIRSIQPLAFHLPSDAYNPVMPCGSSSIPRLDLELWR